MSAVLRVQVPDGGALELSIFALRDRCSCAGCRHPSGQRLLEPMRIPVDLQPTDVRVDGDALHIRWMPEGHDSDYSLADLTTPVGPLGSVTLWDARDAGNMPIARYPHLSTDDPAARGELLRWLRGVERMGCGLLHDVPVRDGEVARVAEVFGHVRATNYGRWFDVRSLVDPTNLANSALALAPHTDNPYRDPVPTMQLLHCLESTASGGENVLVDGWKVAGEVRRRRPDGFDLLVRRSVRFAYRDDTAELCAEAPIIELDGAGAVRSVRFNPRSMQHPTMAAPELATWYDAYLLFAALLADPAFQIRVRLEPGGLFIVDNRRVLHGRTAFATTSGSRHLQGCYADIDGLRSTVAVLSRGEQR